MKKYTLYPATVSFSVALDWMLKYEKQVCVARTSWPHGTYVTLMPELTLPPFNAQDTQRKVNDRTAKVIGEDTPLNSLPYFAKMADEMWQCGWTPTQEDMLARDWAMCIDQKEENR